MTVVYLVLAAIVLLGAAMVLSRRWDPGITGTDRTEPEQLPEDRWTAADVEGLRFRVGLRGYRMEDVDAALSALAADLRARDELTSDAGHDQPEST